MAIFGAFIASLGNAGRSGLTDFEVNAGMGGFSSATEDSTGGVGRTFENRERPLSGVLGNGEEYLYILTWTAKVRPRSEQSVLQSFTNYSPPYEPQLPKLYCGSFRICDVLRKFVGLRGKPSKHGTLKQDNDLVGMGSHPKMPSIESQSRP